MTAANIELVQSLYAAFGRGEIATIVAAVTPDVMWHSKGRSKDHPAFGPRTGQAGVQDFFRIVAETQDVISFTPQEFYATGDHVFVLGHYAWKMHKTGREASSDWVHILTIKNDKVTSVPRVQRHGAVCRGAARLMG